MKNLLFVFFVFAGMITFFTQAMVFASRVNGLYFWLAVVAFITAMVVIGCWSLSAKATNRAGWLFMIVMAAFCIGTALESFEGSSSLLKIGFFVVYAGVGALAFIREKGDEGHGQATAH